MTDLNAFALDSTTPPSDLSAPLQAMWWLKKGGLQLGSGWEKAHEICQTAEGTKNYDWVHALLHWIEGDEFNSDYWYRRAGEPRVGGDFATEWTHIVTQLNR